MSVENRYSRVSRRMWRDEKFRSLSAPKPCAQALWLFLLTGPHCTAIPGLFVLGEASMAEELGWSVASTRSALEEIERAGLIRVDRKTRLVWLVNALTHNPPASPNVVVGWRTLWSELPGCLLKDYSRDCFRTILAGMGQSFADSFAIALGEQKPRPSPNPSGVSQPKALVMPSPKSQPSQDQEQEQEQEQQHESDRILSPTPSGAGKITKAPKATTPDAPRNQLGGEEQEVYDALVGDPDLKAAVKRPGDLAKKLVAAYPSKAVAEEIRKAVAWSSAKGRPIRKATFLTNWLANAEEVVEEPLSQWEKDIHREQDERIAKLRLQRANPELYPPPKPWQPPNAIPHDPDAPKITLADLLKKRDELMATMNARADAACKPIVDAQNGVKP